MRLSRGMSPISILQIESAFVTFILMILVKDTSGGRLSRMPSFYGKRSEQSQSSPNRSPSPNFALEKLKTLLSTSKHDLSTAEGYDDGQDNTDDQLLKGASSLDKSPSLSANDEDGFYGVYKVPEEYWAGQYSPYYNGGGEFAAMGLTKKNKRTLEENGGNGARNENDDSVLRKLREISQYNHLLKTLVEVIRNLRADLVEVLQKEAATDSQTKSRGQETVFAAGRSVPVQSPKRGALSRLPQFYGKRK